MEGVFTLAYSEYDAINKMSQLLKKADGYGFYIPVSRQQKGVDFIIVNQNQNKMLKVQVKASRSYSENKRRRRGETYLYHLWFNNFIDKYKPGNADLYVLYGLYPDLIEGEKVNTRNNVWKSVILCYSEDEMAEFLSTVVTKKEAKKDRFFGFVFNDSCRIVCGRPFTREDQSEHLLENYLSQIKSRLGE